MLAAIFIVEMVMMEDELNFSLWRGKNMGVGVVLFFQFCFIFKQIENNQNGFLGTGEVGGQGK